jgi:GntR family transcriptional repressor for pyruvate dehydrogenase complex
MEEKVNIKSEIAQKIISYIQDNKLVVGDPLPSTREFAEIWKVSRNIVWQGLIQAQTMGLVKIIPRSGAFVQSPDFSILVDALAGGLQTTLLNDDSNLSYIVEARFTIESVIAGCAVTRKRDDDLLALKQALENHIEQANLLIEGKADYTGCLDADEQFHLCIAKMASNPILYNILQALLKLSRPYRSRTLKDMQNAQSSQHVNQTRMAHENIFRSILSGDPIEARKAMENHLIEHNKIPEEDLLVFKRNY